MRFPSLLMTGLAILLACSGLPDSGAASDIRGEPMPLDATNPDRGRIGPLIYRGGLYLRAGERRFGGLSSLILDADGRTLTAVSDRARWFRTRLVQDAEGRLVGVEGLTGGALKDRSGAPLEGSLSDSEAIAEAPDGTLLVAFEHRHRIWRYTGLTGRPQPVSAPEGLESLPSNGGIEAMTVLQDGRILLIAEQGGDAIATPAWIGGPGGWRRLSWARLGDYAATDAKTLPNGDVLVLERRFSLLGGLGARLRLLPKAELASGKTPLSGQEIARIEPPLITDNFEGLAIHPRPDGGLSIYLCSDDNFSPLQRTLLLKFDWNP